MNKRTFLGMISILFIIVLTACTNETQNAEKENEKGNDEVEQIEPEKLSDAFLNGDYEKVYDQLSKEFQDEVSLEELQNLGEDFNEGVSQYTLQSEIPYGNEAKQLVWIDDSGSKGMIAVFDQKNIVQGLQMVPLENHPETDEVYTKTSFDFPFEDQWFVFWGGANNLMNYHYEYENQRYAYDFVMMDDNSTYDGDATLNESYHAFGQSYIAPADGTVVNVENGIKDNEPVGEMNEENPLGNYVILDHGNDEYSYLAHFKYESIKVNEGDEVKQGDVLGQVGNSGNSSEPHIHFHVADSSDLEKSKSIRISFEEEEDIVQGDVVE